MEHRYQTPLPRTWFFQRPAYLKFMAREATSVLVAGYLAYLLIWLHRLGQGPEAYDAMLASARHPVALTFHGLALVAALFHSITWFNLTPKIMPVFIGEERVPDALCAVAMGYLPWLVASGLVLWGCLAGGTGS